MTRQRTTMHNHSSSRAHRGSSLLEVMIAVLVLAIGMLGLAALSTVTIKNSNSAAARSQAMMQVYSLFDTLRLDRAQATAGAFNVSDWTCAAATDPDSGVDYSVFNGWLSQVQTSLGDPAACGRIVCGTASCTAGIRWDDSRGTEGNSEHQVVNTSRL
ncbi:type IV pilus modification protein PilV [Luteimonas sp. A537]